MIQIENTGFGDIKIYQDRDGFRYGIDAVLLSDFINRLKPQARSIADLGTGNGIVPLLLSHKNKSCHITGFDIQSSALELAAESLSLNKLENRINFHNIDVKDIYKTDREAFGRGKFDTVVSNPPYVPAGGGISNSNESMLLARQETTAVFDDFAKAAAWLLGDSGDFFMVHRPSRLTDILCSCRRWRLEPKHIRFVAPKAGKVPNIVLIHCRVNGGREIRYMPELHVYKKDGVYSDEINEIYERK